MLDDLLLVLLERLLSGRLGRSNSLCLWSAGFGILRGSRLRRKDFRR